jgi:predicted nucleotidyltransferase
MQLPQIVKEFIKRLIQVCPSVTEVWAYGSHVNGEARPDSDWDILVLGDSSVYKIYREEFE